MMEYWRHAISKDHFKTRKSQQEKRNLLLITNMDQYPNTSTRIFTHQNQVSPKLPL